MTTPHDVQVEDNDYDTCHCGDYRKQHINGTGRCNLGSLCTPGHCSKFRLFERVRSPHPREYRAP